MSKSIVHILMCATFWQKFWSSYQVFTIFSFSVLGDRKCFYNSVLLWFQSVLCYDIYYAKVTWFKRGKIQNTYIEPFHMQHFGTLSWPVWLRKYFSSLARTRQLNQSQYIMVFNLTTLCCDWLRCLALQRGNQMVLT